MVHICCVQPHRRVHRPWALPPHQKNNSKLRTPFVIMNKHLLESQGQATSSVFLVPVV